MLKAKTGFTVEVFIWQDNILEALGTLTRCTQTDFLTLCFVYIQFKHFSSLSDKHIIFEQFSEVLPISQM